MKVAVCIFGQLRGDDETFESIKRHLVDPNSADVFVHTWNYYDGKSYEPVVDNLLVDENTKTNPTSEKRKKLDSSKLASLISIMKPINIMVEEQVVFDITRHLDSNMSSNYKEISSPGLISKVQISDYQRFSSQSLSKKRVISMVDESYDVVFLLRNDLLMIQNFIINEVVDGVYAQGHSRFIFDTYFYGNRNSMNLVCDLVENIDHVLENHNQGLKICHMEYHLASYINLCGLPIHNVDLVSHFYTSGDGRYHVGAKYY